MLDHAVLEVKQRSRTDFHLDQDGFAPLYLAALLFGGFIFAKSIKSSWFVERHIFAVASIMCLAFGAFGLVSNAIRKPGKAFTSLNSPAAIRVTLGSLCLALFAACVYFGNQQFGGTDQSILIDAGWRLFNHQRPVADFVSNFPPAFLLGAKYAFQLWGPRWDSQLYMTGLFTAGTFLWMYLLFARMLSSRFLAIGLSLCIEALSNLVLAFWWYNPIASVSGSVFFLSCLCYYLYPNSKLSTCSLAGSLFLLEGMKPNTAGPLILGAFVILALFGPYRARMLLVFSCTSLAFIGFLFLNHISFVQLIASYLAISQSRGLGPRYGLREFQKAVPWTMLLLCWFILISPLVSCVSKCLSGLLSKRTDGVGLNLLLILGMITGTIAGITNGDSKLVDMPLFLISGAILLFGNAEVQAWLRPYYGRETTGRIAYHRLYAAFIFALGTVAVVDCGARFRIFTTGNLQFFELPAAERPQTNFFPNLRTGAHLARVLAEEKSLIGAGAAGPVFFGPRLEFGYAEFKLPSPPGLPIFWDPGSLFPTSQIPRLLNVWRDHQFATLIFLKGDYTYYTPAFREMLNTLYTADDRYGELTIYRRK